MVTDFEAELKRYMAEIGKRGGSVKGDSKRRGDKDYYSRIARMRKPKAAEQPKSEGET